jgi:amino acid transporter
MVVATADRPIPRPASEGLRRDVGLAGLTFVSVGSVIGSGWLFGAQKAAALAGPAVLLSWLLAAGICLMLALTYAELGAAYPLSGGTARYTYLTFGVLGGFFAGWVSWLQAVALAPVETVASLNYLSANWWPGLVHEVGGQQVLTGKGTGVAVCFVLLFTLINLVGVRRLAEGNNLIVLWKIAVPVLAIVAIMTRAFHTANFDLHGVHGGGGFAPFGLKGVLLALSGGVMFSYQGFEQAVQLGGEARRPGRDLPRAVITAIVGGSLLYIALQVCFIAATDPHKILSSGWASLGSNDFGPFYDLSTVLGLTWLATVLQLDAIVSPGGTALVYIGTTSRLSFALGRTGAPASLARLNRRRVPWVGVTLAAVAGCLMFLPFGSWAKLVNYTTSATFFMYALAPVAVLTLRRTMPDVPRSYRLPHAQLWTPAAFALATLIVYWSGFVIDWRVGVAMLFGLVLLVLGRTRQPAPLREALRLRAVAWIPVWVAGVIGLAAIGPDYVQGRGVLPFYLDMVVVAAFSLVIFYWAVRSALPAAEVHANYDRMRAEVETETAALTMNSD